MSEAGFDKATRMLDALVRRQGKYLELAREEIALRCMERGFMPDTIASKQFHDGQDLIFELWPMSGTHERRDLGTRVTYTWPDTAGKSCIRTEFGLD